MAKSDNRITKLRKDVEKLRKNYTGAFTSANRAVYDGIEQLAEHELAAIKTHYEQAISSLKTLRKGGAPRELAVAQLQLIQDTIDRIMSNARESMAILDSTRSRINEEIRRNLEGSEAAAKDAAVQTKAEAKTVKTQAKKTAKTRKTQAKRKVNQNASAAKSKAKSA